MFKSKRKSEYYNSIDELPIKIWDKIHKDYDLTLLCKERQEKYSVEELETVWNNLYNEFLLEFGLPGESEQILKVRIEIAQLKCKWIVEGKRFYKTLIKIEEEKLKELQNKNKYLKVNLNSNLTKLSRFFMFKISSDITVVEYYSYLKEASNG